MELNSQALFGMWKTDQGDPTAPPGDGDVTIEFRPDCTATHALYYPTTREVVDLSYRVEQAKVILWQSSNSSISFVVALDADGSISMTIDALTAWLI